MQNIKEIFGRLDKIEELTTIKDGIIPGTLVFESLSPFTGYYNQVPDDNKPMYLYMGVDQTYSCIHILRTHRAIKQKTGLEFEATKALVHIKNRVYDVVRLRHLSGYNQVKTIQEEFEAAGIHMYKSSRKFHEENCHIHFEKQFYIEEISDGIFIDRSEPHHAYLQLPKHQEMIDFEITAQTVKNNWLGRLFDAAPGTFCINKELIEMVRIYSKELDLPFLKELKKLYADKI